LSPIEGKGSIKTVDGTPKSTASTANANPDVERSDFESGKWIGPQRSMESRFLRSPKFENLDFPGFPGANAIWGATGRDCYGQIYFGVSSYGDDELSAALFRYDVGLKRFESLGLVNKQLDLLKVRRKIDWPETQMKIHSKIYQAADGRMYFSTQDEHDEANDGSRNALYGGRLMAMDPRTKVWESIHTSPEGLIALAARGRYIVAQGYFGHVLYQYDTKTKSIQSVKLGTYKGHSSRNIFMDARGHVYGIRARLAHSFEFDGVYPIGQDRVRVSLVELDTQMQEVHEWPLDDYSPTGSTDSHGLTGFCEMEDGTIVFVTHTGALWQIRQIDAETRLERLGWMHPKGKAYCASLYAPSGERYVCGLACSAEGKYEWIIFDTEYKRSVILPLDSKSQAILKEPKLLLYGSDTLDDSRCGYLVGRKQSAKGNAMEPVILKLIWE
jgi:hypothetical protein